MNLPRAGLNLTGNETATAALAEIQRAEDRSVPMVWASLSAGHWRTYASICPCCDPYSEIEPSIRRKTLEVKEILEQARDTMTVKRVFGDPYEKDGVTVIPVARVGGGGGGGGGGKEGEDKGFGAGYGLSATPAGVYVIRDGRVDWRPAVDLNKVIMGGQFVAIVLLLTIRTFIKARARSRRLIAR